MFINGYPNFNEFFNKRPSAKAVINGSDNYPNIRGTVWFYSHLKGVLVVADIEGLPTTNNNCNSPIFAFHIHEGSNCTGNEQDNFLNVGSHYNPNNCPHPYHAGDLPPLFGVNGNAFSVVLTDRVNIQEIVGRTIIIHSNPDDFVSQPAGNSGTKIACGEIRAF